MDNSQIESLLSPMGLPIAYWEFYPYDDSPPPAPPYLIYFVRSERSFGSDDRNLIRYREITVELYTDKDNIALKNQLESRLEEILSGFAFEKSESFLPTESMYMDVYEFETYEKIIRR